MWLHCPESTGTTYTYYPAVPDFSQTSLAQPRGQPTAASWAACPSIFVFNTRQDTRPSLGPSRPESRLERQPEIVFERTIVTIAVVMAATWVVVGRSGQQRIHNEIVQEKLTLARESMWFKCTTYNLVT